MLPMYCPIPDWFQVGRDPSGAPVMVDKSDIATSESGGSRRVSHTNHDNAQRTTLRICVH